MHIQVVTFTLPLYVSTRTFSPAASGSVFETSRDGRPAEAGRARRAETARAEAIGSWRMEDLCPKRRKGREKVLLSPGR